MYVHVHRAIDDRRINVVITIFELFFLLSSFWYFQDICKHYVLSLLYDLPGASMGNPTRGKGHEEGGLAKGKGWDQASVVPLDFPEHLPPKPEFACFIVLCFPLFWRNRGLFPPPFSGKSQLRAPLDSLLHIKGVFQLNPSDGSLTCLTVRDFYNLWLFTAPQLWEAQEA